MGTLTARRPRLRPRGRWSTPMRRRIALMSMAGRTPATTVMRYDQGELDAKRASMEG